MKGDASFKTGDMVVRFGEVCKIIKIEKRKNNIGNVEEILYYKPYFSDSQTSELTYSISVKNLSLGR